MLRHQIQIVLTVVSARDDVVQIVAAVHRFPGGADDVVGRIGYQQQTTREHFACDLQQRIVPAVTQGGGLDTELKLVEF